MPFDDIVNKPHHQASAISDVTGIHNTEAGRERRASTLPNYYRPFSRTKNDRKDNVENILVAYKTKKAESFRIVHPMLKKTFKQRILPWQEHMKSKNEVIDEDDLKKVEELEKWRLFTTVFDSDHHRRGRRCDAKTTTKNSYEKLSAGEKYGDPKNITNTFALVPGT